jgi:Spy/CpxP family protein refolding chaperone
MKRILILTLAAGLLSVGTPALVAQVSTNSPGQNGTPNPDAHKKQMERRKMMKLLGLTQQELKGLTPEERHARIKEATDQKIAQLQQKKADGTITAEEVSDLAFLQKRGEHAAAKAASDN